jgi:hypothetical protein
MAVRIEGLPQGTITVQNAAEEDTLQNLVALMNRAVSQQRRQSSDYDQQQRKQSAAATDAAESLNRTAQAARSSESVSSRLFNSMQERIGATRDSLADVGIQAVTFGRELAATATNIGLTMTKKFRDIDADPITFGAEVTNTALTTMGQAARLVGNGLGGMLKSVPLVGDSLEGLGQAAGGAGQLVTEVLKIGNNLLAKELAVTVKNNQEFNKMGASFSGGMLEMRQNSYLAGVTLDSFTGVIKASRDSILAFGTNVADGSEKVAHVMFQLETEVGRSGQNLRDELYALGVSYEEQGEMAAQYMANLRATMTAEQFRAVTEKQVAQGTRQYAEDLKVLADITGKNAKQELERARMVSMQQDILARLDPAQADKFRKMLSTMPEAGKKGFLELISSGGTAIVNQATVLAMNQNEQYRELIYGSYRRLYDSSVGASEAMDFVGRQSRIAGEEQKRISRTTGGLIGTINRFTGSYGELSDMQNQLIAAAGDPDAVERSRKAAKDQAGAQDEITQAMVAAKDATNKFAMEMQVFAGTMLPGYSKMIKDVLKGIFNLYNKLLPVVAGQKGLEDLKAELLQGRASSEVSEASRLQRQIPETIAQREELKAQARQMPEGPERARIQERIDALGQRIDSMRDTLRDLESRIREINPPRYARGGIAKGPESGHLAMLHGDEAIIPLQGMKNPVELKNIVDKAMPLEGLKIPDELIRSAENNFNQIKSIQQNITSQFANMPQLENLPTTISTAIENTLMNSNGLLGGLEKIKNAMVETDKQHIKLLQQHLEKLEILVSSTESHIRVSERIANEIG